MDIYWDDRSGALLTDVIYAMLTDVISEGLTYADAPENCEISVSFVSPEEIKRLNKDYRRQDRETDVLSFPFYHSITEIKKMNPQVAIALGDIIICVKTAEAQAGEYGHSLAREMAFLTTHGLLHLLGYTHENGKEEQKMIKAQNQILNNLGITR